MKNFLFFAFLISIQICSNSQNYTLSGYIKDKETGEELLGAIVRIVNTNNGTATNQYGFYTLSVPKGTFKVVYSYMGYSNDTIEIKIDENIRKNVHLERIVKNIEEIIITAKANDANVKSTNVGTIDLSVEQSKKIPVLLGEADIIKSLQLLPGVSAASEGSSGFYVRGGDANQNVLLLDEAPVYNASHLLGFFSVFNSDAINEVTMYKAGIPAKFGSRISSVTDIRMRNGNANKWQLNGGIGLISSRITIEGPIVKQKASILTSFRRTYADLVLKTIKKEYRDQKLVLYFYDFNFKANVFLSKDDRLFTSFYSGTDDFGLQDFGFSWGNQTATLRWNHLFSDKIFLNTTVLYSKYDYNFLFDFSGFGGKFGAGIYDYSAKQDFSFNPNSRNSINWGWISTYHSFKPMAFKVLSKNPDDTLTALKDTSLIPQYALESAVYLSNEQKIGNFLVINYGLRYSIFNNIGPITYKSYDAENQPIDTFNIKKGNFYNTFQGFEPRINITILLNERNSIKLSYNRTYQYLHLLSKTTSSNPLDMWIPSSPNLKPQYGDQWSVGYFSNFFDNILETSVEVFYKNLYNQVDYENGAQIYFNPDVESLVLQGIGRAYGAEFLIRKNIGNFTGWIAYTILKSERKFNEIENGNWYPARQDRRHDVAIVLNYELFRKFTFSTSWVYTTGDAVTFPVGKYTIDGHYVYLYSSRNGDRMPDYHRLDFGFTWKIKETKNFACDLNLSIYNVYNRKNAYSINFNYNEKTNNIEAERLSLFGTIPAITFNFRLK